MLRIETCIYIHLQVEYVSVSDKICHYMYMYYFTTQILKTCGVKMSDKWILKQLFYCPKSLANLTYKSLVDIFY